MREDGRRRAVIERVTPQVDGGRSAVRGARLVEGAGERAREGGRRAGWGAWIDDPRSTPAHLFRIEPWEEAP